MALTVREQLEVSSTRQDNVEFQDVSYMHRVAGETRDGGGSQ